MTKPKVIIKKDGRLYVEKKKVSPEKEQKLYQEFPEVARRVIKIKLQLNTLMKNAINLIDTNVVWETGFNADFRDLL
jgi:hypothetical protein